MRVRRGATRDRVANLPGALQRRDSARIAHGELRLRSWTPERSVDSRKEPNLARQSRPATNDHGRRSDRLDTVRRGTQCLSETDAH
jgi:hypothetical protein